MRAKKRKEMTFDEAHVAYLTRYIMFGQGQHDAHVYRYLIHCANMALRK
jgi:hypothetical protein